MEMSCNFDRILYATCTTDSNIKSTAKENSTLGIFTDASYTVVASTAPEMGALKDRPFIPECQ